MNSSLDLNALAAASIHEVKNLLGQLTLSLDEIAQAECPEVAEKAASARFACRRIVDQLTEMLTLYKLEEGHLPLHVDAHSPADFLEDLVLEARALTGGRIEIVMVHQDAPPFWFFDPDLIENALMNALHNALAHAQSRITLSVKQDGDDLVFQVQDDGCGYSSYVLETPLNVPRQSQQGTGLGLYFAQSVALAHENKGRAGKVKLGNAETGGAIFSLYLP